MTFSILFDRLQTHGLIHLLQDVMEKGIRGWDELRTRVLADPTSFAVQIVDMVMNPLPPQKAGRPTAAQSTGAGRTSSKTKLQQALLSLSDSAARKRSSNDLEANLYAESSKKPRKAQLAAWNKLAAAAGLPPIPITVQLVDAIASALRAAGYRAPKNIFSRACQAHVETLNEAVPPAVQLRIKQVCRGIVRDSGGGLLKQAFLLEHLPLAFEVSPVAFGRHSLPLDGRAVVVIGTWFMLRGAEIRELVRADARLNLSSSTCSITVRKSKTDQQGQGHSRTHGCSCQLTTSESSPSTLICPFHCLLSYLQLRDSTFPATGGWLFPTVQGSQLTPSVLSHTVCEAMRASGTDPLASTKSTGQHCLRVSGAQLLARAGIDLNTIKLMGRWSSEAVQRYTQDAPLATSQSISATVLQRLNQTHTGAFPENVTTLQQATQPAQIQLPTARAADQPRLLPEEDTASGSQVHILNPRTNVYHIPRVDEINSLNTCWVTKCGWRYGLSSFERTRSLPSSGRSCPRCLKQPATSSTSDGLEIALGHDPPDPQLAGPETDSEELSSSSCED